MWRIYFWLSSCHSTYRIARQVHLYHSFHAFSSELKIKPSLDYSKQILCVCILMSIFTSLNPIKLKISKKLFLFYIYIALYIKFLYQPKLPSTFFHFLFYPFSFFHPFLILISLIPSLFFSLFTLSSFPPSFTPPIHFISTLSSSIWLIIKLLPPKIPSKRSITSLPHPLPFGCSFHHVIKRHNNISTNLLLYPNRVFRSQEHFSPVIRILKFNPFFWYFTQFWERYHLKTSWISQDVSIPVHIFVETTKRFH